MMSDELDDWAYHGIRPEDVTETRILVEEVAFGPTERKSAAVIRELPHPPHGGFLWGYIGGSPTRAAEAMLADALGLADTDAFSHGTLLQLRNDFSADILSQMCDEWRLRRSAVLRWVRGWYAGHGLAAVPEIALRPPEADLRPGRYERRHGSRPQTGPGESRF